MTLINSESRAAIVAALIANRKNFEGSDAKYAASLSLNPSVLSRLMKGETDRLLSEAQWITTARRLDVPLGTDAAWLPASTAVFDYITAQLSLCQIQSLTSIFCDVAGIGKTFTAKTFCKQHKNAVYVDCSQVKSRQRLIRYIAQQFGLNNTGKYAEVYEDLTYYMKIVHKPLIVLDEAGDLDYPAWLELKALWNASEHHCGWYMMGADGLQAKIDKGIASKKVGFTEIFNRYGSKYNRITPLATDERKEFMFEMAAAIITVNHPQTSNVQKLIAKSNHHLRSLYNEIIKQKRA